MRNRKHCIALGLLAAAAVWAGPARAAFVKFDDFNTYPVGLLNGQGPAANTWTAQAGATVAVSGGDNVANIINGIPNFRSLTPTGLSIPNANTASTVYWNFTQAGATTNNNWNFIVTDDAAPVDTAATSEVQFNFDATQAPSGGTTTWRARNGSGFIFLSADGTAAGRITPKADTLYNVWFVINNSANTYKVFMQSDGDPLLANVTQMKSDGNVSDFGFRNGAAANDLVTVNMGNGGSSAIRFDDVYVDTSGQNLTNPVAVPEPASLAGLAAATLGLLLRRRR
jgi:hypothetical protein